MMWFSLQRGARHEIELVERQSIWPAPDGSDAELLITTEARLEQEIILVTPRVLRLVCRIRSVETLMTLGEQPPAPWAESKGVSGRSFELMLTEKGPLVVPGQGEKLPNRLAKWQDLIAEDVRSCWPVPPADIRPGTSWSAMPAVPGGLPPDTTSARIRIEHLVTDLRGDRADIRVRFGVRVALERRSASHAQRGDGRGELHVRLDRTLGVSSASRTGRMELVRPTLRNQVLRSTLQLQRV